jgi:hypothetical protein
MRGRMRGHIDTVNALRDQVALAETALGVAVAEAAAPSPRTLRAQA